MTAGGDVAVTAQNTSSITATIDSETSSNGVSVGVVLAFNTVGVESQNVLFNIADAILGLDLATSKPVKTVAQVASSSVSAGGALTVSADSAASIEATIESSAVSIKATFADDSNAISVDAVVAMNRVRTDVKALVEDAPLLEAQDGDLSVTAADAAGVSSEVEVTSIAVAASAQDATGVSVGVSVSRNEITTMMEARISDVPDASATDGDVIVAADETARIDAISRATAIGVAASLGSSIAVSGGGAIAVNLIDGTANVSIAGSGVDGDRHRAGRQHLGADDVRRLDHRRGGRDRRLRGRRYGQEPGGRDRLLARPQPDRLGRVRRRRPGRGQGLRRGRRL